ncbi:MAG: hypothetical protein RLN75_01405, partial [Longimicrobiales bacterium]
GGAVIQGEGSTGGYTALFARRTSAIVSWACGEGGRRYLTLNLPGRVEGPEVAVRMRVDGGDWESRGRWRVQTGPTDAVVAPEEHQESLTRSAVGGRALDVVLTADSGAMQAHGFDVEGLGDALAERPCWAAVADAPRRVPPD